MIVCLCEFVGVSLLVSMRRTLECMGGLWKVGAEAERKKNKFVNPLFCRGE